LVFSVGKFTKIVVRPRGIKTFSPVQPPSPPKWRGRTVGAGVGGEREGSGMRGNGRSIDANLTSTLLPDTNQQHVQMLKLHCIFIVRSNHTLILTTSKDELNNNWCSFLALE